MSAETTKWLNNNVLVGFTDKRGRAWHYKESDQGAEPNHYPMAIPVADVVRRLFNFQVVEAPVFVQVPADMDTMTTLDADGNPVRFVQAEGRKAMVADDNWHTMGMFKEGYQGHQYDQWLLGNVANILSDELAIGSAGLLKDRAVAWVQCEVPDNVNTPEGVAFRPNLLATTSFDGSIATTYKRTVTVVVCDNTRECALGETGQQFKVKHSRYSHLRLDDAKAALAMVESTADAFAAEVAQLCQWEISKAQWDRLLNQLVPVDAEKGKRATTLADNKRSHLRRLYTQDERAATWNGTAFGVLQAFNTYNHHLSNVRGSERVERNMLQAIGGGFAQADVDVLAELAKISGRELVTV